MEQKETLVLFFDPCHLQHNVTNARMWQPKGKNGTLKVKTNTGRKRINIIGALDVRNFDFFSLSTEKKCNSIIIVEFLSYLRQKCPEKKIIIILDNASYSHAHYTKSFAEWYNIELFFLPPYSPNLNLIERLWKFSKKMLVHNKYYETFTEFRSKVNYFLENLSEYNEELKNLITKKFQILHAD